MNHDIRVGTIESGSGESSLGSTWKTPESRVRDEEKTNEQGVLQVWRQLLSPKP